MIYWRCVKCNAIRCKAYLILRGGKTLIIKNSQHNHSDAKNENNYYNLLPYQTVSLQHDCDNRKEFGKSLPKGVARKVEAKGTVFIKGTNRNGLKMIYGNYTYLKVKQYKNSAYLLKCSYHVKHSCKASITLDGDILKITNAVHNHETDVLIDCSRFYQKEVVVEDHTEVLGKKRGRKTGWRKPNPVSKVFRPQKRERPFKIRECMDEGKTEPDKSKGNLGLIYIESGTKNPKIIIDKNKFAIKIKEGNRTRWRCTQYPKSKCRATLVTLEGVVKVNNLHNHSPTNPSMENYLVQQVTILRGSTPKRPKLNYASKNVTGATGVLSANSVGNGNLGLIYIDSRTETRKIILGKNQFIINNKQGNRTFWRCTQNSKTKCRATLATYEGVVKVNNSHNHKPTNPSREKYLIQQVTILRGSTPKRRKLNNKSRNVTSATVGLPTNSEGMKKQITKTSTVLKGGPSLAVTYKKSKSNNTAAKNLIMSKKPHWTTIVKARRLTSEAKNQQDKKNLHWRTLQKIQQLKEIASSGKNLDFMYVDNQFLVFRGHTYRKHYFTNLVKYYQCRQRSSRRCLAFLKIYELDGKIILGMSPMGHSHGQTSIDYDKLTRKNVILFDSFTGKIIPKRNLDEEYPKKSTDKPKSRETLTRRLSRESKLDGNKSNKPAAARKVVEEITSDKPEAVERVAKEIDDKIEQCYINDVKNVKNIKKVEPESADNDEEKSVTEQENVDRKGIIYFDKTSRHAENLIFDDYEYQHCTTHKKYNYWKCTKYNKGCQVRLILSGNVLSATDFEHSHPPPDREASEDSLCRMVTIMLRDPQKKTAGRPAKKSSNTETVKDSHTDTPCGKETKKKIIDEDGSDEDIIVDIEGTDSNESAVSSGSSKERSKEGKKIVFVPSDSDSDTSGEMSQRNTKKYKGIELLRFKIGNTDSGENKAEQQLKKKMLDSDNASSAGDEQSIYDFDETMEKLMLEENYAEFKRYRKSYEEISLTDENSRNDFQDETDALQVDDNDTNQYQADQVDEKNQDNNDKEIKDQAEDGEKNNQVQAEQVRQEIGGNDQHQSDDDQPHGNDRHQSDNEQLQKNGGSNEDASEINQPQSSVDSENQHNSEDEHVPKRIKIISYYTVNSGSFSQSDKE